MVGEVGDNVVAGNAVVVNSVLENNVAENNVAENNGSRQPGPPDLVSGWYALGLARELERGSLWRRRLHGRELVVGRTESGRLLALDAYCPHLGAHVGYGGTVVGETIRCPFHGFRYDGGGHCVATGYGKAVPRSAVMETWPVREVGGVIVAWAGPPGTEPGWEIPPLDMCGWSPWKVTRYAVSGHPQETTENSVDLGHFSVVHGYRDVAQTRPLDTDGPHLTIGYGMTRQRRRAGIEWPAISTTYDIDVWGLGWSRVEVQVRWPRLRMRLLVLATQVARGEVELRLAVSMPRRRDAPGAGSDLSRVPPALAAALVVSPLSRAYTNDVRQDFSIWQHKRYLARPALAAGDGPIAPYRRWAQQFYFPTGATPGAAGEREAKLSGGSAGSPW